MTVFALMERVDQSDYTEPHCYSQAADTGEIIGIFSSYKKAAVEKAALEELARLDEDDNMYYEIVEREVE